MDNIFGIGLPEFVLILVIAGMVMGPERIARTARSLGALTARLQTISRSFFRQLNAELDSADTDGQLKSTVDELNQLRRQVSDLRNEVFTLASGAATETKQAFTDIRREAEHSILPPSLSSKSASQQTRPAEKNEEVHRPPSLADRPLPGAADSNGSSVTISSQPPPRMPNRLDITEDPDG